MARAKWFVTIVGLTGAVFASVSGISGTWKGSIQLNSGSDQSACMTLKQEGRTLTGTAGACNGKQFPITKGTVEGPVVTVEAHPGAPTLKFDMKLNEDKLTGDVFEDEQRIGTVSMEKAPN
jgi:hypothetical protein